MSLKITCPHCKSKIRLNSPLPQPGSTMRCQSCTEQMTLTYPPSLITSLKDKGYKFEGMDGHAPPPKRTPKPPVPDPKPSETQNTSRSTRSNDRTQDPTPRSKSAKKKSTQSSKTSSKTSRVRTRKKTKTKSSLLFRLFKGFLYLSILLGVAGAIGTYLTIEYYSKDLPSIEQLKTYRPPTVTVIYDRNGEILGELYKNRRYVVPLEDIPEHVQNAFIAAEDANFWEHEGVDYMGVVRAVLRNAAKGKKAQGASTITQQVARNFEFLLSKEKTYERKIREILLAQRMETVFPKEHILYLYLNQIYFGSGAHGIEAASRVYFNKNVGDLSIAEAAILAGLPQRPSDYSPHSNWESARSRQVYVLGQMKAKGYIEQPIYDEAINERVPVYREENQFLKQAPYYTEHVRRYLLDTYGEHKVYEDGLEVVTACDLEAQKIAQHSVHEFVARADRLTGWRGPLESIGHSLETCAQKYILDAQNESTDDLDLEGIDCTALQITGLNEGFTEEEHKDNLERIIEAKLSDKEAALCDEESKKVVYVADKNSGQGGNPPPPAESTLVVDLVYEAVVLEVKKKHIVAGIGRHRILIPGSWTEWAYEPNTEWSYKHRKQTDLNKVVKRGDIINLRVEALDSEEIDRLKGYTAAGDGPFAAGRIWQDVNLEGALLSYRVTKSSEDIDDRGAVLAMVGGYSFEESEFNRAIQAYRQVGSTFKPIVYAAAIESRDFTVASIVQDAPTVYQTLKDELWKPGNYGQDYLGNITLRRALQMSRNVCTIRVLDRLSLDRIYELAGPKLRIGYDTPDCTRKHLPDTDTCEGTTSPSPVEGMQWCEACKPESCSLVKVEEESPFVCLNEPTELEDGQYCRSCDVNLRVCDWLPIVEIPEKDTCVEPRIDPSTKQILCRSCDLSMGLGSSSLTMLELARAYSVFATYGQLIQPYFIESVLDRDGTIIESHLSVEPEEVMEPSVAGIAHWLVREVATGGTGASSNRLRIQVAGKTGTTNDFFDAWFVGYTPDIITATWVGYDQPKKMGVSFTGGTIALPMWMDYVGTILPPEKNKRFAELPGVQWITVDETTGLQMDGGRRVPVLRGTAPKDSIGEVGQKTVEDFMRGGF